MDEDEEYRVSLPFARAKDTPVSKGPVPSAIVPPIKPKPTNEPRTFAMSSLRTSRDGLAFIAAREGQNRITDTLHWPGGESGVTLGFGYDFRKRDSNTIVRDLTGIGVSQKVAKIMSLGTKRQHDDAKKFIKDNVNYISISDYQKQQLLVKTIGEYENRIKKVANFPVTQYQFDALVSLAYDSGRHLSHVPRAIAADRLADAEKDWLSRTHSEGVYKPGLADRRKRKVNLFNNGIYK